MSASQSGSPARAPARGTLYIVGIFGALVALGWLALYGLFLQRLVP